MFTPGTPPLRRIALAAFACINPAVWYLDFTGVEVFSWSLVTIGFVTWDRDRLTPSALAFALAALQNPPLLLLAGLPPLLALLRRRWRTVLAAGLCTAIGLLPFAFCFAFYGKPSLITSGYSDPKCISLERSFGLIFDLNQGLFPYVPVLLLAALLGCYRSIRMGDLKAWLVLLAAIGMAVAVQIQVNWNSDCRGMMRYLQWQLPALAWLATAGLGWRGRSILAGLTVFIQGAILLFDPPSPQSYVEHRPLARWVMTEAPYLYNPEFEIFTERQAHIEAQSSEWYPGIPANSPIILPLAFGRTNGEVKKLMVHRESAPRLVHRFTIAPEYLPELLRIAESSEKPIFVHPPRWAVTAKPWTIHGTMEAQPDLGHGGAGP